jgi:DEAD/DEAH box helicase domain-containing protein
MDKLREAGLGDFYAHQASAIDLAMAGNDVVVTSGTSSGKTLCYNAPVIDRLLSEPAARALYLFPTKALAQDQLGKLRSLLPTGITAETYDGDTPISRRTAIRSSAHVILTNPDMLHVGILPNHAPWARFFRNLRFVVLDEMHTYSGAFGSHVGNIMRRLSRICAHYSSSPQFIACSATIANPDELFSILTSRRAEVVADDASPSGKRYLLMWNPPLTDDGSRRSSNSETSQVLASLAARNVRTLAFARSRMAAELVLRYTRESLRMVDPDLAEQIESYRAGYTAKERRAIEAKLFKGELLGLSATDALELGVDIGLLDAVVMNGFPGSISSLRQQAGRAGRGTRDGLAILVARNDPLEQYLMRHPELILGGKAEAVRANPANSSILTQHLLCAAHERPIAPSELDSFPENAIEILEQLEEERKLMRRSGFWFYPFPKSPAPGIDIRGEGGDLYQLETAEGTLGTMERWRAFMNAHPGAVYLHRGEQYFVREIEFASRKIRVEPVEVDYYTQSISETQVLTTSQIDEITLANWSVSLDNLHVTTDVTGFRRKSLADGAVLSIEDLDLPQSSFDTVGVHFQLPSRYAQLQDGVHAIEHLLLALAPTIAHCEPRDLASAYYGLLPGTTAPAIFIFDSVAGGIGLSEALFASVGDWVQRVTEQLASCKCYDGCPACILSTRCPYSNEGVDKSQALAILQQLGGGS